MSDRIPRPPREGQDPPARHLRIVRPSPSKPHKKFCRRGPLFTADEEARVRAVLRTARAKFGTWGRLADALRVSKVSIEQAVRGRHHISGDLAVRLARALGVPLESLYRPGLRVVPFPSICPTCGRGQP